MSSLMIRAEDWDQMAQSGRGSGPAGPARLPTADGSPGDVLPTAVAQVGADRVAALLAALARTREVEQQLQACIEQIQAALQQPR